MKRFLSSLFIVSVVLLMQISPIFGFSAKYKLSEMSDLSPVIVTAKTIATKAKVEMDKDELDVVYTYVNVEVLSCIKGSIEPSSSVTIKMLGGRCGSKGTWSELYTAFNVGEENLLFLHPIQDKNNMYEIKSISSKLPILEQNTKSKIDCSMLRYDDFYLKGTNSKCDKNVVLDKIKYYVTKQKGGK